MLVFVLYVFFECEQLICYNDPSGGGHSSNNSDGDDIKWLYYVIPIILVVIIAIVGGAVWYKMKRKPGQGPIRYQEM